MLGLDAAKQMQAAFKSYPDAHIGSIATLEVFGKGSGLTSSKKTMSFVTNHDTDRNPGEYLGHKDGATFILANEWLLASGYGSPQVFSSFEWETAGRLTACRDANGLITDADCTSESGLCDHRDRGIVAMVKWHNYVGQCQACATSHTDDANVIAFSKDGKGWAAFNNGTACASRSRSRPDLPQGTYCDVIHGKDHGQLRMRQARPSW